jgi:tetratricopeptide (TPR) repeat protein
LYVETLGIKKRILGGEHPQTLVSMSSLAAMYQRQGRSDDAKPFYKELLEINTVAAERPDADIKTLNEVAWTLLTHEIEEFRSPSRALIFAERACKLEEESGSNSLWIYLDTLALAQFMTGDTASAVETQRKAISLMPEGADPSVLDNLANYESALSDEARQPESDD